MDNKEYLKEIDLWCFERVTTDKLAYLPPFLCKKEVCERYRTGCPHCVMMSRVGRRGKEYLSYSWDPGSSAKKCQQKRAGRLTFRARIKRCKNRFFLNQPASTNSIMNNYSIINRIGIIEFLGQEGHNVIHIVIFHKSVFSMKFHFHTLFDLVKAVVYFFL
jgi:hypothetical protein